MEAPDTCLREPAAAVRNRPRAPTPAALVMTVGKYG